MLDPGQTFKHVRIFNTGLSAQLKIYIKQVPKYVEQKYIVHINILSTLPRIVSDTLKIKMSQIYTERSRRQYNEII